jgi:flavin-dependent dehydrogenase
MESWGQDDGLMDLAIVGGGPAGTVAALEASRRGLRTSVWERECFPRDKVCGEFISPEALPWLERETPEALARAACIRRSEFVSPSGRRIGFTFPEPARGLSRRVLDEALWRAASAAGAKVWEGTAARKLRKVLTRGPGEAFWELKSSAGSVARARSVVLACGRWWNLEGFHSPARERMSGSVGPWLGAKAHFAGVEPSDAVEMYFFPGGYCGLAPIEDGLYNACCLAHRGLARRAVRGGLTDFAGWLGAVSRHPLLTRRLRGAGQVSETVATAPLAPARRQAASSGVLKVGDASGFLDPFTGDGISMAIESGRLAAEVLAAPRGRGSAQETVRLYRQRLGRGVRRSYWVAGLLRLLVAAPAGVQDAAAQALVRLAPRLFTETRWRGEYLTSPPVGV